MSNITPAELEMAQLFITALNLEGKDAAAVEPTAPLFGQATGSWGLDSIDALEIALAVQQKYGVEIRAEDESVKQAFSSLRALHVYVSAKR